MTSYSISGDKNEVTRLAPHELLQEKMFEDLNVNNEAVYYSKMKGELIFLF